MSLPRFKSRAELEQYVKEIQTDTNRSDFTARKHLYQDIEDLIQYGHLICPVQVDNLNLCMRSLSVFDIRYLAARIGLRASTRDWKEWAIATSIWMVDGQSLLEDANAPYFIHKYIKTLPMYAINKLFSVYTGLYNRMSTSLSRIEAFCYEDYSRSLWRSLNQKSTCENHVQRVWVAFNLDEDIRDIWDRELIAARFVASATSPKGVKQVIQADTQDKKRRKDNRDQIIYRMVAEATGQIIHNTLHFEARTVEDLETEMQHWLAGEKDLHDLVVDAYKDTIRKNLEEDRKRYQENMQQIAEGVSGGTVSVVSDAEFKEYLANTDRTPKIYEEGNQDRMYDRYLNKTPVFVGMRPDGKFEDIAKPSLQESIVNRKVGVS